MAQVRRYTNRKLESAILPGDARTEAIILGASGTYTAGTVLGEYSAAAANEVQTATITGTPTGGTFTLTFDGYTTSALAYNATGAVVQAALEALASIGTGNVTVSLSSSVYTITFRNALGYKNVPAITATASLTGGTSPDVTMATTVPGLPGPGTYGVYDNGASNGLQTARCILAYDVTVNTFGEHLDNEWGTPRRATVAYIAGYFKTEELTGLDSAAVTDLGRLVSGTTSAGVLKVN